MHDVSCTSYTAHTSKKMNISFTRLGHEDCGLREVCAMHKKQTSYDSLINLVPDCDNCVNWAKHHRRYTKARELYDSHKKQQQSSSKICYSADLGKVIMLPRLDTFKAVIFCNRLIAYNQTFAPDVQTINIWLDNSSAQNKNWLLYSLLIHMVNSNLISAKIILFYFEPGHTLMSCDKTLYQEYVTSVFQTKKL